jgi:predicted transglutaminase-like cysteine proteinase
MRTIFAMLLLFAVAVPALAAPRHIFNNGSGVWPIGFSYFCLENPADCEPLPSSESIAPINYLQWESRLDDVNRRINAAIIYTKEEVDHWAVAPKYGDCDDYAITKRAELVRVGLPKGAMQLAFALLVTGESHLVLLINTTEGYKVLDNNFDEVFDLEEMMISRLSIQGARNPREWEQKF